MDKKVLIGLTTQEMIRKANALPAFLQIEKPAEWNCQISTVHGQSPAEARNILIRIALDQNFTHIYFADDDMIPPPDVLKRLMAHDKDIVTGLYLKRDFPHLPVVFDEVVSEKGECKFVILGGDSGYKPELVPVVNMGFGCVLVKTSIFEKLTQYAPYWVTLGEIVPDGWSDDVAFFNKCGKAGIKMYCDLSLHVGHMATVTLFPKYVNGNWYTEYNSPQGNALIPQHAVNQPQPTP